MKKLSKILALVLVLMMVLATVTVFNFTASAAETTITFKLGADKSTTTHGDGNQCKTTYTETVDGYKLTLTPTSSPDNGAIYTGANDATGNGCIKLGTSSATSGFTFTVPDDVTRVEIHAAKYKAKTSKLDVNGTTTTLTNSSDDGKYDVITVDTSVDKTVTVKTVSGGVRAMINSIVFVVTSSGDADCTHENTTTETVEPTCTVDGKVITKCANAECGAVISTVAGEPATGHKDTDGDYKCDNNCGTPIAPAADVELTFEQATALGVAHTSNTYTSGKYYLTGTITGFYITNNNENHLKYGNVYIEDENGNSFLVYGLYTDDGNTRYDSMTTKPIVGDKITVYGIIGQYNGTAQMKNGWVTEHTHEHAWVDATFEAPKTCSTCGATDGEKLVAVAQIGEQKYASLQEALNVGGEVVLLTDIGLTDNKGLTVPAGVVVVLDLNGHVLGSNAPDAATSAVITNKGTLTIKDTVGTGKITTAAVNPDMQAIPGYASNTITNLGTLTLESGLIENTVVAGAAYAVDNNSNGVEATFTMNGGKLSAARCALRMFCNSSIKNNVVTINDGEISGGTRGIWVHLPGSDSTKAAAANLTINGGTITNNGYENDFALYVYSYGNNHSATYITITGGTFDGGVVFGGGYNGTQEILNITGGDFRGYFGRYLENGGWENFHMLDGVFGICDYKETVVAPTCVAAGKTVYTCACGDTYEEEGEPATGHVNTTTTTVDATCTTAGSTTVTCACGYVVSTTEVPALGHDMAAATCTAPSTCKNGCGHTEGETLAHNYVDGECSNCKTADPNYAPEQPEEPTEPEQPTEEEEDNFFAKIWAKILAVLQTVLGFFKGIFVKG